MSGATEAVIAALRARWTPLGREAHDVQLRSGVLAPILAECDFAEQHQRNVVDDEVLVAVGLIRRAALDAPSEVPHD